MKIELQKHKFIQVSSMETFPVHPFVKKAIKDNFSFGIITSSITTPSITKTGDYLYEEFACSELEFSKNVAVVFVKIGRSNEYQISTGFVIAYPGQIDVFHSSEHKTQWIRANAVDKILTRDAI